MTFEPAAEAQFRLSLLTHPGERQDAEYKASIEFRSDDDFSLKLLRQIQGFANCGGGWIVIGFSQTDGRLEVDASHSDAICGTYEPTRLTQLANAYVERRQQLRVTVHFEPHPTTGIRHPLIRIEGFERTPYVCRSTKEASDSHAVIFEQGAVYLRRQNASTSKVSTPEDWEEIISRAVSVKRDDYIREFRELFERMRSGAAPAPPRQAVDLLRDFMVDSRTRAGDL